jgi:hypothetical protein
MLNNKTLAAVFCWSILSLSPLALYAQSDSEEEKCLDSLQLVMDAIRDSVFAEAKELYYLERAAWVATDLCANRLKEEKIPFKRYGTIKRDSTVQTFFYGGSAGAYKVYASARFPAKSISEATAVVSWEVRPVDNFENDWISKYNAAFKYLDTTIVSNYQNISLCVQILDKSWGWQMYLMSGTTLSTGIALGNDAVIKFKRKGQNSNDFTVSRRRLHKSLVWTPFAGQNAQGEYSQSMHKHLLDDGVFTASELCMLMLYRNYYPWKISVAIGNTYYSQYDKESDYYLLLTTEAIKKIWNHQDKLNKERQKKQE